MTSLSPHYRDDFQALQAHLTDEHAIFSVENPDAARAHLCCTDYRDGPALKSALQVAAGGKQFVRTALNNRSSGGYCAIVHLSSASAGAASSVVHAEARCSPLTHASKEPFSLMAVGTGTEVGVGTAAYRGGNGNENNDCDGVAAAVAGGRSGRGVDSDVSGSDPSEHFFGLKLGPSLQEGPGRGLVVSMSPGSVPFVDSKQQSPPDRAAAQEGARRSESSPPSSTKPSSFPAEALEKRWRDFWGRARGIGGAGQLAEVVPWTRTRDSPALVGGDKNASHRRGLLAEVPTAGEGGFGDRGSGEGEKEPPLPGPFSRAQEFHGGKAAGYKAALDHLGEKMGEGGGRGLSLSEACGWDDNLSFVHGRNDLLYLR